MLEGAEVRLAVDIGGTFTDIVLDVGEARKTRKLLTTLARPEEAVLDGMRLILADARAHISDIDVFIHGTTLATNAIIERRGAKTALIATEGFRDVIEIGRETRYDLYDLFLEAPPTLVPRHRRRSDGSIDYNHPVTPQLAALAEIPDRDAWVGLSRQQAAAWEALLREVLTIGVRRPIREGQPAPWPWPPGKDGKLYAESTDPPESLMTESDWANVK